MKPSGVSSRLRSIASRISRSSKPDKSRVASAVRSILAGMEGGTAFIHMTIEPEDIPGLDPDGKLAAEFSKAVASYGGVIENWEGEWLEIEIPRADLSKMIKGLEEIESGKHGPGAQKIAEAYSVDEVYGDDGEGNPGDVIDPSEYGAHVASAVKSVLAAMGAPETTTAASASKFFLLIDADVGNYVVEVKPGEEKVWEDTKRYLADCGINFAYMDPVTPISPGQLSDELAPRDD